MKTTRTNKHAIGLGAGLIMVLTLVGSTFEPTAHASCQQGCNSSLDTFLGEDVLTHDTGGANTGVGALALSNNGSGSDNTAIGVDALLHNSIGSNNTAVGVDSLFTNRSGNGNTAVGLEALLNNNGSKNTAIGEYALVNNTSGIQNTAIGESALLTNKGGNNNLAAGWKALYNNVGSSNTALGVNALFGNTSGSENVAVGGNALLHNSSAMANTAVGEDALENTLSGGNTAIGHRALRSNTRGDINTACGLNALLLSAGTNNIALGADAGVNLTSGDNNIDIGNAGASGESDTIRIGDPSVQTQFTFIAGISGATAANGTAVFIEPNGHLGTMKSSARFKEAIKPMDKASESILALKPVTFRYKHELDPQGIPQFGLVAEEVEKVNPDLVVRDAEGKVNTVRYEAVNAMLLNEFLKEHCKVEAQEARIAELKKQVAVLSDGLRKVSEEVELQRSNARVAKY